MESVRSRSGQFARTHEHILFPSDCVSFIDAQGVAALGRVKAIGLDRRDNQGEKGVLFAIINRVIPRSQVRKGFTTVHRPVAVIRNYTYQQLDVSIIPIIASRAGSLRIKRDSSLLCYISSYMGLLYELRIPEILTTSLLPHPPSFCVRYIVYRATATGKPTCSVRGVAKMHCITAEGELIHFTHDVVVSSFVDTFNSARSNGEAPGECISVPR